MSKFKFVLNRQGVRHLLNGSKMTSALNSLGQGVQSRAGVGYELNVVQSKDRKKAIIVAETFEAKRDNMKNNTLLKALK